MSAAEIKSKIAAAAEQLDEARALQLLTYAHTLLQPQGTPGRDLLKYLGSIDSTTAQQMLETLRENRQVDDHAW